MSADAQQPPVHSDAALRSHPHSEGSSDDSDGEAWHAKGLWRTPQVILDWDNLDVERSVSWSELFFDLIFVTSIAELGEALRGENGEEALSVPYYILMFLSVLFTWLSATFYSTRFNLDSLYEKLLYFALMSGVLAMAMHIHGCPRGPNGVAFAVSAAFARAVVVFANLRVCWYLPEARPTLRVFVLVDTIVVVCWIASAITQDIDTRVALFTVAVLAPIGQTTFLVGSLLLRKYIGCSIWGQRRPLPLSIPHFSERFGLFTVIVLGEAVTGVSIEDPGGFATGPRLRLYAAVFCGLVAAYSFKLLYFDTDCTHVTRHAMRRSAYTGILFLNVHYPLVCSLAILGSGLDLICKFQLQTGDPLSPKRGMQLFAYGTAVTVTCLLLLRLAHAPPATCKIPHLQKVYIAQLVSQAVVVVAIALLPTLLPESGKGALAIVAITAALLVCLVAVNLLDEMMTLRLKNKQVAKRRRRSTLKSQAGVAAPLLSEPTPTYDSMPQP